MATAVAITGAKARDRIKLRRESLSNMALNSVTGSTKDDSGYGCLLQKVIDVPVKFLSHFEMVV